MTNMEMDSVHFGGIGTEIWGHILEMNIMFLTCWKRNIMPPSTYLVLLFTLLWQAEICFTQVMLDFHIVVILHPAMRFSGRYRVIQLGFPVKFQNFQLRNICHILIPACA